MEMLSWQVSADFLVYYLHMISWNDQLLSDDSHTNLSQVNAEGKMVKESKRRLSEANQRICRLFEVREKLDASSCSMFLLYWVR